MGYTEGMRMGTRRLDLGEAASVLGVSREAVRRRAKRGTLDSERGDDGKLYVWVHDDDHTDHHSDDVHHDPLVEELRDRIRYLEEESRRKDHLLAAALERIPAIEAPESPESTSVGSGNTHGEGETQDPISLPWWRRWLGWSQ
jgi:hypothetical protein